MWAALGLPNTRAARVDIDTSRRSDLRRQRNVFETEASSGSAFLAHGVVSGLAPELQYMKPCLRSSPLQSSLQYDGSVFHWHSNFPLPFADRENVDPAAFARWNSSSSRAGAKLRTSRRCSSHCQSRSPNHSCHVDHPISWA